MRDAVANRHAVVARSVEHSYRLVVGRAPLHVGDVGSGDQRRRSVDDVIDLADEIVLGDRGVARLIELAAVDDADVDVRLADIDRANLLVDDAVGNRALDVLLQFVVGNVAGRAHVARGPRIRALGPKRRDSEQPTDQGNFHNLHGGQLFLMAWGPTPTRDAL